jgi:hypothetical protein
MVGEIYGLWRVIDFFLSNPCSSGYQGKEEQKQITKLRDELRKTLITLGHGTLFDGR